MTLHDDVARLADTAMKLLYETERLHRDILTLLTRIAPRESDQPLPALAQQQLNLLKDGPKERWTVTDAFERNSAVSGLDRSLRKRPIGC